IKAGPKNGRTARSPRAFPSSAAHAATRVPCFSSIRCSTLGSGLLELTFLRFLSKKRSFRTLRFFYDPTTPQGNSRRWRLREGTEEKFGAGRARTPTLL